MYLDESAAGRRLESPRNLANRFGSGSGAAQNSLPGPIKAEVPSTFEPKVTETQLQRAGNKEGKKKLPIFMRNTVAILTRSGESQASVGREFGITRTAANKIAHGKVKSVDEALVAEKLGQAKDIALDRLTAALLGISDEKLSKLEPEKLSTVAANMSKVIEKMTPGNNGNNGNNISVHIYSPETRREDLYPSVAV